MRFRVVMHVLEYLAVYASRERSVARALTFLRRVLKACEDKPPVVVDRGPWYPWALRRLGISYFGERNRIERRFRKLKERTRRFNNNVNAKSVENIENLTASIATIHNILKAQQEVIPT